MQVATTQKAEKVYPNKSQPERKGLSSPKTSSKTPRWNVRRARRVHHAFDVLCVLFLSWLAPKPFRIRDTFQENFPVFPDASDKYIFGLPYLNYIRRRKKNRHSDLIPETNRRLLLPRNRTFLFRPLPTRPSVPKTRA